MQRAGGGAADCALCAEEAEETLPVDGGLFLVSLLTVLVGASIKTQAI